MIEHYCTPGVRGGFFQRLDSGTWAGHILEHVALELQTRAGMSMSFGKAREAGPRGVYKVIVRTDHEEVGKFAMLAARELILAAIHDTPYDVPAVIAELTDLVDSVWIGPSTASIVAAAHERRIPYIRLNAGNLVQLGYGNNQRRIWTAETDSTSAIAEIISEPPPSEKVAVISEVTKLRAIRPSAVIGSTPGASASMGSSYSPAGVTEPV
jgi:cyanophycin synthetase